MGVRQPGAQDRVPGERAQHHREAHEAEADEHPRRRRVDERVADPVGADALQRDERERECEQPDGADRQPARHARAGARGVGLAGGAGEGGLERRQAAGGHALAVGGRQAELGGQRPPGLGVDGDRVLVGAHDLAGDVAPGVARRRPRGGGGELGAAGRVQREVAQRLGQRGRVAARHEHAVRSVRHDVAIAGDVGGDDRGAGRERLRQDHAEALAAERRGAQDVGVGEHRELLRVAALAVRDDVARVEHERREARVVDADDVQRRRHVLAQRLEGAQQDGQALALDGLADEGDPQRVLRRGVVRCARRPRQRRRHVDPVGDDPVRPAEEAPPGPRGGLRDGDPHVQAVQPPPRAEEVREVVGEDVLRVAVERRDERRVDGHQRVPAGDRRDRLVQVHDVVAALELAAQRHDGADAVGDVRDRAVGREADRAAQRDEVLGQRALRRARSTVQAQRETVVRIDRRQDADLVPGGEVLLGERLDVARHSPWVRPRIRRHQRDPHRWHPICATPRSPKARM